MALFFFGPEQFKDLETSILNFHRDNRDHPKYNLLLLALAKNITKEAENLKDKQLAKQWIETAISLADKLMEGKAESSTSLYSHLDIKDTLEELKRCEQRLLDTSTVPDFDHLSQLFNKLMNK